MLDTLFFWSSKLFWLVANPAHVLWVLLVLICILLWLGAYKFARRLLLVTVIVLTVLGMFPVGEWLLAPLENRYASNPGLPATLAGIVVLGGAEDPTRTMLWEQPELGESAERELAFLELARKYPGAKLVFTGGSSSLVQQGYRAADVARSVFEKQGLDRDRMILEGNSRNTYENAVLSAERVSPSADETWVLITSAWHMPRAVGVFCQAGWRVIPYPVDHQTMRGNLLRIEVALAKHLSTLGYAMKEWSGLMAYFLTGKTGRLFPGECSS